LELERKGFTRFGGALNLAGGATKKGPNFFFLHLDDLGIYFFHMVIRNLIISLLSYIITSIEMTSEPRSNFQGRNNVFGPHCA
jgi:hypothetical protein